MDKATYIATTRFGLGAGVSGSDSMDIGDPKSWLLSQIQRSEDNLQDFSGLTSSSSALKELGDAVIKQQDAEAKGIKFAKATGPVFKVKHDKFKAYFKQEKQAKVLHASRSLTPFYERLVDFWSNHFTVSYKKDRLTGIVGAYEREAIRPNITGKFIDMLMAVEKHPAMLMYLDNAESIGPNSQAGMRGRGLNENLAREIMELHTVGVNGGYTQADVTTFAKAITGWTVSTANLPGVGGTLGSFAFVERRHEPGDKLILGKKYVDNGVGQGEAVLRDLAASRKTADFIAYKLARHFIADTPKSTTVQSLSDTFFNTGGDLKAVYTTLVNLPEAWTLEFPKVKSGYHLIISARRAAGKAILEIDTCLASIDFLGDGLFSANSPAGISDITSDIIGPEQLLRRVDWARHAGGDPELLKRDVRKTADNIIGPIMSKATSDAIDGAIAAQKTDIAFAFLFGSPEFQRR